jgi:hypothetical protein
MAGAGARDRRLRIWRAQVRETDLGEVNDFVQGSDVWAEFEPAGDGQRLVADQLASRLAARFWILWRSDLVDLGEHDEVELLGADGRRYGVITCQSAGGRQVRLRIDARAPQMAASA